MIGQWLGNIAGSNVGYSSLDIDPDRPAEAFLQVDDPIGPFAARATLTLSNSSFTGLLHSFTPGPAFVPPPGFALPTSGSLTGTITGSSVEGTWATNIGTSGTFRFRRSEVQPARSPDHAFSWPEFRDWALSPRGPQGAFIYRGHRRNDWPLVTTFHRTGRRSLLRYDQEDVPRLQRALEAIIGKRHVLSDPYDYGALLNLSQHHGYPTPLLDWTESPFVAAWFAFESLPTADRDAAPPVRILAFDRESWPSKFPASILSIRPTLTPLELGTRDNPRALPQQSVNVFANVVDIEGFISLREAADSRKYILCIDIPASERPKAIADLTLMGVTASSLYPGIEGTCRALKERFF